MDEAEAALRELGVAEKSIHLERFNTPGGNVKRAAGVRGGRAHGDHPPGRARSAYRPSAPKTTASWMPHCVRAPICRSPVRAGVCATCKCKVLRGEVAMAANYSLEADELAAGYVLSCQSLPTSGDVVVDFDARGMA